MVNNGFICIINEGTYRHPIYYCNNGEPQLVEYCPIEEMSDELERYSQIYNTNNVYLDGQHSFILGVKEQIKTNIVSKYGKNNLNIELLREE
jgi:hypothetical protein